MMVRGDWLALLLFCVPALANCGVFNVAPIRANLGAKQESEVFKVKNDGNEALVVQAQVKAWTQREGQEEFADTRDVLVTPPIFTLAPQAEQILRVGLRRAPDEQRELSYRLFLSESPAPPEPGFQGIKIAMQIAVPIFVAPLSENAAPDLQWRATRLADQRIELVAMNRGNVHIRLSDLRLESGVRTLGANANMVYVLAGQRHAWFFDPADDAEVPTRIRLRASTDATALDQEIIVE